MQQLIAPNPNIPCQPGWCLAYVNEAFGVPKRFGSATAAWNGSATKHRDWNFPAGVWLPVWFSLATEPAGHVALRAPDGSVYSTSDDSTVPHHHPDMADLIRYYAAHNPLTYLGWTEDVEGSPIVAFGGITPQGTITPIQEDDMPSVSEVVQAVLYEPIPKYNQRGEEVGKTTLAESVAWQESNFYLGRQLTIDAIKETVLGVLTSPVPDVATGGTTNLATEISWLPANFKHDGGALDVDALAASIASAVVNLSAEKVGK